MKLFSLLAAVCTLAAMAACQSTAVTSAPSTYAPAGAQSRYTVDIPASNAPGAQPYALQGTSNTAAAVTPTSGYQAR